MANKETFRISAALKNLIGKELITDEYVAVFELVKNSFDAYATKVEIIFENLNDGQDHARLIIKDNGKGMNYDDLKEKWLFVAKSAKIDGTEDNDFKKGKDYRDKIQENRIFAGAKGIGRFSCDRLGKKLNLITIKDEPRAKVERLYVNWEIFERDQNEEFVNVKVEHEVLDSTEYKDFKKGTILEIIELRDNWDRNRLLRLKHSLEKLINPNQENDVNNFKIDLIVKEERLNDASVEIERNKVNGPVKNFLFETLKVKTTQIFTEITNHGETIETTLKDREKFIYKIIEKNIYSIKSNIRIHLFQLNRAAKLNFKMLMGIEAVNYGSVFLYKNGFRVYPFGEIGEDRLGMDRRKIQQPSRNLGTRDLLGRIEINDEMNIDNLKETTSRDGGLIKNENYDNLIELFFEKSLKRLEKYVVDLIKWGNPDENLQGKEIQPEDIRRDIIDMIANFSKDEGVLDIVYDKKNIAEILKQRNKENLPRNLKNFEALAEKTNDPKLKKEARKLVNQFKEHHETLKETERELDSIVTEKKQKEEELLKRKSQVRFFQSIMSRDYDQAINFLHHVGIIANTIDNNLKNFYNKIQNQTHITKNDALELLNKLSYSTQRILSYTDFATKANYKIEEQFIEDDLKTFIFVLLDDTIKKFYEKGIDITINENSNKSFIKRFQPVNFKIVFDNLLSNSRKAKAKNININFISSANELEIHYKDDGVGLAPEIKNPEEIFEQGITTTKGSGLGLYHVREVLKEEKGTITLGEIPTKGIVFIVKVKR